MRLRGRKIALLVGLLGAAGCAVSWGQVVVFQQAGFPGVEGASLPADAMAGMRSVGVAELPASLADVGTKVLVMPYGAAFPEEDWGAIYQYLQHGGGLVTLGGRAFTRPVYRDGDRWAARPETYAFVRELQISDYQAVGSSAGLKQVTNRDVLGADLPELSWEQAYSVVIRLSFAETSTRIGASGTPDSDLRTLLWGEREGRKIAAPVILIDHFRRDFAGGRWVMMNCDPEAGSVSREMVSELVKLGMDGSEELRVTPTYPLYVAGEGPALDLKWTRFGEGAKSFAQGTRAEVTIVGDHGQERHQTFLLGVRDLKAGEALETRLALEGTYAPGFHRAVVTLRGGAERCGVYRTGFWVRDEAYLASGPKVTVDHDYFQVDGRQMPVVGTTYMDSKAQRLLLRYPNPYRWDEDMQQMSDGGLNMLRTGLWTDWAVATDNTDIANEHTLRTIEAFLMTARRHGLPVQFNLFAFMPEVFGGGNPYLDPEAVKREQAFVMSVVERFKTVPFLIWDLMNEPSFDNPKRFFGTKPNGDAVESAAWNRWLLARYGSREAVASLWKMDLGAGAIPVPDEGDFYGGSGDKVLSVYDFNLFTQEKFAEWVQGMRRAIREGGSQQLITVGTDEGGGLGSVSPAFFNAAVDFTTMHSWWLYDDLLWDSLVAKQAGKPMLVQETGVMFEQDLQGRPRRTLDNEAALLERKVGIALGTGAGAIEWLWNVNALMQSQQEVTIGANRWDGTEKPEAEVLKSYAKFVGAARDHFKGVEAERVVILTSQALQYSPMSAMATMAQQLAVRVMNYQCGVAARVVSENNVADIAGAKLVVLPSPQALSEGTWKALLAYVEGGGNLLITGPLERDEHWQPTRRLAEIGVEAEVVPLNYRGAVVDLGDARVQLGFGVDVQKHAEALRLADGRSYVEVKRGRGRIFVVASPVELAESPDATAAVYKHVIVVAGVEAGFSADVRSPAVLIRPRRFADSTLYVIASEASQDEALEIVDRRSGGRFKVSLPAEATRLVLVDAKTGVVLAAYDGGGRGVEGME
jgi:hypothetical protein